MEAVMMRDPKEDKRQKMLQRLPEMMRILRAYFVTEKKPALLKREIIQKLIDSCRSSITVGKYRLKYTLIHNLSILLVICCKQPVQNSPNGFTSYFN